MSSLPSSSLTKAAWRGASDVNGAVDALGRSAGSSFKEMRDSYFLFGMPSEWDFDSGLQLIVVEIEDSEGEKQSVEATEIPFPSKWLDNDSIPVDNLSLSEMLSDEDFGLEDEEATEEEE